MTKSQQQAVERFRQFVIAQDITRRSPEYGADLTEWNVKATDYGTLWIKAQTELVGLPINNLLRALNHNYYFASVGRRGAITLKIGPKSLAQFEGGQFLGININYK
jgi:hypothetical protein